MAKYSRKRSAKRRRFPKRIRRSFKRRTMKRRRVSGRSKVAKRNKLWPKNKILPLYQAMSAKKGTFNMRYNRSEVWTLTSSVNGTMVDCPIWSMTNPFDPDYRLGGSTAQPWDEPAYFFEKWVVERSKITYTFKTLNNSAPLGGTPFEDTRVPAHIVYKLDNDAGWAPSVVNNWTQAMVGMKSIKHKAVDLTHGFKFTQSYNRKKHFASQIQSDSPDLAGGFTAPSSGTSPLKNVYSLMRIQSADFPASINASVLPNLLMEVQIDYVVTAYNPTERIKATGN